MASSHSLWIRISVCIQGGASGKEPACQCRRHKRHGFNSWIRKISWRRAWKLTLVFLPEKSHGQRNLMGYSPQGRKESDTTEVTWHTCIFIYTNRKKSNHSPKCLIYIHPHVFSWVCVSVLCSVMSDSVIPWIVTHQASLSMGFPRQEYWSGFPLPPPGYLSDLGI